MTATAEEAGTYEVRLDFDVLVEIGDRAVVREGARRIIVQRRNPAYAAGVLPLYDWRPEDVTRGWLAQISNAADQNAVDAYTDERRRVYFDALDVHRFDLHAANLRRRDVRDDVRERVVRIVRDIENLRTTRVTEFFLGPSDERGLFGRASYCWWDRVEKIRHYVHDRLHEARVEGRVEPVPLQWPRGGDSHRAHNILWRATS